MALSANSQIVISPRVARDCVRILVDDGDHIYQGAAVGLNAGAYAIPLTTSATAFAGFADEEADNTGGGDGAIAINVIPEGVLHGVSVTGASQALLGNSVYMSDDNTLTMVAGSNIKIGHLQTFDATEGCQVYFVSRFRRSTT